MESSNKNNTSNDQNTENNEKNKQIAQDCSKDIEEIRKHISKIIEQMVKNTDSSDFLLKSIKDIKNLVEKHTDTFSNDFLKNKLGALVKDFEHISKLISKDNFKTIDNNLSSAVKHLGKIDDMLENEFKEMQIHLDAITETTSILQESNEHIKSIKSGINDFSHELETKIDDLNETIKQGNDDIVKELKENNKTIEESMKLNKEFLNDTMKEIKNMFEQMKNIAEQTESIFNFEKELSVKREKEFALMQSKHLNEKGLVLFYRGVFSAAQDNFFKALELNPKSAEINNNIGHSYLKMKDLGKSEEYFKKAIEIFPDFSEAYNNLGLLYMDNNKYELAIENIKKAITLFPDFSDAYLNIGNVYQKTDRIDEAIDNWSKSIEINPFNEEAKEKIKLFKKGDVNV